MDLIKMIKNNWLTLILMLITISSFLFTFSNSEYLILGYISLGLLFGWLIYDTGFLKVNVAEEHTQSEKEKDKSYYLLREWPMVDKSRSKYLIQVLMLITILVIVFTLLLDGINQTAPLFGSDITRIINLLAANSWLIFVILFSFIYLLGLLLFITKKIPEEVTNVFQGKINVIIFAISIILYVGTGIWAFNQAILRIEAVIFGLFFLPIALVVSRVEGKYFYLYVINQWNQFRDYDILKGTELEDLGGLFKRLKAFVALIIVPISLTSTLFGIIDVFTGNLIPDEPGLLENFTSSIMITLPELTTLILFFLTIGPLLILLVRPFSFVEVWLNQGLYEKMVSPWDLDTLKENMDKYNSLFRIPHKIKGFYWSLYISGAAILALIGLNFIVSFSAANSTIYIYIQEGLFLVSFITSIVFFLSLIELSFDPIEEKTFLLFGHESRRAKTDLLNYSLYGEWLLYKTASMDEYLTHCPERWGLPWFLKGLNLHYNDEDRLKAFEQALKSKRVLLKAIIPIAWNDYGVLLTKSGRNEEALNAFIKGQEALGRRAEDVMKEIDEAKQRETESFIMENVMISEPATQSAFEMPMYAQMAISGGGGGEPSSEEPSDEKGRLLSYEELVGTEDRESFTSLLDRRYDRRARSKLTRNLAYLTKLRNDLQANWQKIKFLDEFLKNNPENAEKWAELGEFCQKMNFTEKAKSSYETAAELYRLQGNNDAYEEIQEKIDSI